MEQNLLFLLNSGLLGIGLSMDAFSVSIANGLQHINMKRRYQFAIAGIFALFQFLMPMLGWTCIRFAESQFHFIEKLIPWLALLVLGGIGCNMIIGSRKEETVKPATGWAVLWVQAIATSIDALSAGFSISSYSLLRALVASGIVGVITFIICFIGVNLGKKAGSHLAEKAGILGGVILILIGLEIFIKSLFFS